MSNERSFWADVIIYGSISVTFFVISWTVIIVQRMWSKKYVSRARKHLNSGDWRSAAGQMKNAILASLSDSSQLKKNVDELAGIYEQNGIDADLSRVFVLAKEREAITNSTQKKEKEDEVVFYLRGFPGKSKRDY